MVIVHVFRQIFTHPKIERWRNTRHQPRKRYRDSKPPKPETLLNPDWSFVDIQDKGAMIRGEYDLTNNVMGYATYGQSKN